MLEKKWNDDTDIRYNNTVFLYYYNALSLIPGGESSLDNEDSAEDSPDIRNLNHEDNDDIDEEDGDSPSKPVLRKHGKLISFFRSFILSRPARGKLKKSGILKERVFGCDLSEHLLNTGQEGVMTMRFLWVFYGVFYELFFIVFFQCLEFWRTAQSLLRSVALLTGSTDFRASRQTSKNWGERKRDKNPSCFTRS